MSNDRSEIRSWLEDRNYSSADIDRILLKLDQFDSEINRKSLFDDLASGAFDLGPIIKAALEEESPD